MSFNIAGAMKSLNIQTLIIFVCSLISMVFPKLGSQLLTATERFFSSESEDSSNYHNFDSLSKSMLFASHQSASSTDSPQFSTNNPSTQESTSKSSTSQKSHAKKQKSASSPQSTQAEQQTASGNPSTNCSSQFCSCYMNSNNLYSPSDIYSIPASIGCNEYSCTSVARNVIQQQNERYQQHLKLKAKLKKNAKSPIAVTTILSSLNLVASPSFDYIESIMSSAGNLNHISNLENENNKEFEVYNSNSIQSDYHNNNTNNWKNQLDYMDGVADIPSFAVSADNFLQDNFNRVVNNTTVVSDSLAAPQINSIQSTQSSHSVDSCVPSHQFNRQSVRCNSSELDIVQSTNRLDVEAGCDSSEQDSDESSIVAVVPSKERKNAMEKYEEKLKRKNRQVLRGGAAAEQYFVNPSFALIKRINALEDSHSQLENSCSVRKCPCLKFKRKHAMRGRQAGFAGIAAFTLSPSQRLPTIFENIAY